jgi:hypothetical protein
MDTLSVKIIKPTRGSPNGIDLLEYPTGTHTLPRSLAEAFIQMGVAQRIPKQQKVANASSGKV